jgi:rod shape-determining protein MreD
MSPLDVQFDWLRPSQGNGLRFVALLMALAVFLQVTLIPRLDIGPLEATPNLVVVMVVAIAMLRGVVVGAVVGFAGGLLVELLTPGETLGVLALAYVAIGAWSGRFAASSEPVGRVLYVLVSAVAAALVPIWMGVIELLRGQGPDISYLLMQLTLPHFVFSILVAWPAWWAARRLLGAPREVEPWLVPA